MSRIPFGVSRLDRIIGGGAPTGSVVLLAGEAGAGAREFLFTAAVMNGLLEGDRELFDLHYGDLPEKAAPPDGVHYLSLTGSEGAVREEIGHVMASDLVAAGADEVTFADLSPSYFHLSPVPREWYANGKPELASLGSRSERRTAFGALADYVEDHAADNLVLLDSVSNLVSLVRGEGGDFDWSDLTLLLEGLTMASHRWEGLVLPVVNKEMLTPTELGALMEAVDGTLLFEWASGGSERDRTLVVKQFRGVLSRLEAEDIVRFEGEIGDAGYDVSDVRKIR